MHSGLNMKIIAYRPLVSCIHNKDLFVSCRNESPLKLPSLKYTLIWNAKSHSLSFFDEIMIKWIIFAHYWSYQASRISGNWKKANKGHKGQIKGQGVKKTIFSYFLVNLASFGVSKAAISIFLNLKAIKAKKATIVAWNGNLQRRLFTEPKLLFWHSEGLL